MNKDLFSQPGNFVKVRVAFSSLTDTDCWRRQACGEELLSAPLQHPPQKGARETQGPEHPWVLMPFFQHHRKPAHEGRNSLSIQTTSTSLTAFSISPNSPNDLSQRCNLCLQVQHHLTPTWRATISRKAHTTAGLSRWLQKRGSTLGKAD